jgi:hypothetical protein
MGAEAVNDVQRGSSQWRKPVRARACGLRPRGTGLGVGGVSHLIGTQCSWSPASDRRSGV